MKGTKKQVVRTGFAVGGRELQLVYDTTAGPTAKLWNTNFHKDISFTTASTADAVVANRGSGVSVGFESVISASSVCGVGGTNAGPAAVDSVSKVANGFQYKDEGAKAVEYYDATGRLSAIYKASGQVITNTYSDGTTPLAIAPAPGYLLKASDTKGRSISFEYVLAAGQPAATGARISRITNSAGQTITLGYDTTGNLSTLTWPDAKVRTFVYEDSNNPWALTGIIDENNSRFATWTYAPTGQALSSEHAGGVEKVTVSYTSGLPSVPTIRKEVRGSTLCRFHEIAAPSSLSMVNANGMTSTATIDSSMGYPRLSGLSQPAGSGCAASTSAATFDGNGDVASKDDFRGTRTCYVYDAKHQETMRVEGLANTVACATVTGPNATLPAGARRTATRWHPDWRVPTVITTPGAITTNIYQGQPDPFAGNAFTSCSPATDLPNAKRLPLACKQVIQPIVVNAPAPGPAQLVTQSIEALLLDAEVVLNQNQIAVDKRVPAYTPLSTEKVILRLDAEQGGLTDASGQIGFYGSNYSISSEQKHGGSSSFYHASGRGALVTPPNSALVLGTGDFSLSGWFNFSNWDTDNGSAVLFDTRSYANGSGGTNFGVNATSLHVGGTWLPGNHGMALNTWYNIEFKRVQGILTGYVNGVAIGSITDTTNHSNDTIAVGACIYTPVGACPFTGYLDDVVVKTIVTAPRDFGGYPALSQAGYTVSTAQKRGGGSSYYNASGRGYITSSAHPDLQFGTGDFSLSGWFNFSKWDSEYGNAMLFDTRSTSNGGGGTYFGVDGTSVHVGGGTLGSHGMSLNTWYNIEFKRDSGVVTVYVNGVPKGSTPDTSDYSNNTITIGACSYSPVGACPFNGYIDDVRVAKLVKTNVVLPNIDSAVPTQVLTFTYDTSGRVLTSKDSSGFTTNYAYYTDTAFVGVDPNAVGHTIGDLQTITDAKGMVTTFNSYDKSGRVLQMTDAKGIVTAMTYYPRGWIKTVTVTPPGGPARLTTYTYDNVGQLTGVSNPDGTTVGFTYDAAHRLVGATDARGNSVTYTLDNVGNRISEQLKDPGGVLQRSMSRSFDALNRVQQLQVQ